MNVEREEILGEADRQEQRLRAAADSANGAADRAAERADRAAERARHRARQAREWARTHWSDLQHHVERRPYSATVWALGIGFVTGMMLTGLVRWRH
jgi:ElaB/YqjD/DUF883 family membrane-anchored ribosome-binding protein